MKKRNLFSDLAEIISEKEKKQKMEQKMKEIKERKERNKVIPLKKQKFSCLYPMVKNTISDLMKALKIRGHLYNLSREKVELCYSDGRPNDFNNRILTIRDCGNSFVIVPYNSCTGDQTNNLSQENLVETLKESDLVKDALKNL